MKNLEPLMYFLGVEVHQTEKGVFLHQHKYITDWIEIADNQNFTPMDTPLEVNVKLQ